MRNDSFDKRVAHRLARAEMSRADMHDYQREDVRFFKEHPFSFGLLDIGMGKTVTAGTLINDLLYEWDHVGKILVVGPIPIVVTSWPDEFSQWGHLAHNQFTVLREDEDDPRIKEAGRKARKEGVNVSEAQTAVRRAIRLELTRSKAPIHLINFEGLEWLTEHFGARWPYRTVIVDELTLLKNNTSARFKALAKMRNTDGLITRMHLLSGSIGSEGYMELWAPTYLLDKGERFGKNITAFRDEYFIQNKYDFTWKLRPGAKEQILAKLGDIATIRRREDYFDVRQANVVTRRVVLHASERAIYDRMFNDAVVEIGDSVIEAETAAALSQKLCQLASGSLYETELIQAGEDEDEDLIKVKKVHHIHDRKIEMLKTIVDELSGHNLLVSYQHRSSLDRLQKAFPQAVKWDKTGKSKGPWNAGKIPMMLMHPKSGAHGNNLQKGGHYVVFFDIPWSRDQFVQLVGRLDRQGQEHPVTVICLTAVDTIDEKIAKAQVDKRMDQDELIAILKKYVLARKRMLSTHG